jgi:RNA polymerase sigma factor (sigma-70 family)
MKQRGMTDQELVKSYLAGNQPSLEVLIRRHQRKVFGYILTVVRDRDLAEDIFQDTFFKVINKLNEGLYNEEGKFLQWVMRIAHNLTIDHFRRDKRMPTYSGNEEFDIFDTLSSPERNVEQGIIRDQIHSDVVGLIELLPDEQREVLKMRIYAELSFKEIADITGVSINTALGRMRYALMNLRKIIKEKELIITED